MSCKMDVDTKCTKKGWKIPISRMAESTFNPIRAIVDTMKLTPNPDKAMISLSIGDPTIFGNLPVATNCEDALIENIKKRAFNGYTASVGFENSRQAVAEYVSTPTSEVQAKDVILASGCSSALDLCISCLAQAGDNILMPRPGFSLYKTLAESLGIECRMYNLLPERSWEVDLEHLESLIDDSTSAIIVCNPSNPCGSVFSREHILEIINLANKHKIPIIADEIYDHFVFTGEVYYPFASLSKDVPILACGGLTKRFLVPGWRMGWVTIHDRHDAFVEVRKGLVKLSQRILGPNSIVQSALPSILKTTPQAFFDDTLKYIENNAKLFYKRMREIPGLQPVMPQGAMYMMVGIDIKNFPEFQSDVDFTETMVTEQSVFCLPASCFQYPNFFRVVLTVPTEKVEESCERIREFCEEHFQPGSNGANGYDYPVPMKNDPFTPCSSIKGLNLRAERSHAEIGK